MVRHSVHLIGLALSILLITLAMPASVHAKSNRLLQTPTKTVTAVKALPQWQRILQSHQYAKTRIASPQYQNWQKFVQSLQHESKIHQLLKVNQWFQQFSYKQDNWVYGKEDHWATPAEFLKYGGDCEDFAIIKYMSLRQLGFPAKDLKITMVYDVYSGTDHAFLIAYHNGAEFVLDNREKLVVSRYMKKRYRPYYAFNEKTLWTYDAPLIASRARKFQNTTILPGNR